MSDVSEYVAKEVIQATAKVKRELVKVIAEAERALERLEAGQRPAYTMGGQIISSDELNMASAVFNDITQMAMVAFYEGDKDSAQATLERFIRLGLTR